MVKDIIGLWFALLAFSILVIGFWVGLAYGIGIVIKNVMALGG